MVVLVALHEAENQVLYVEGSVPHPSVVVPSQRLLVLGRAEEGDVASFVLAGSWHLRGMPRLPIHHTP